MSDGLDLRPIANKVKLGKDVYVDPTASIEVEEACIGDRTHIGAHVKIKGTYIELGRECWLDEYALIGGGSCFDQDAYLVAGDWLHMGMFSQINIARGVDIGDECGVGIRSAIFTHGAYLPFSDGFPVQWGAVRIGDRVWLPHAWINPGVTIGSNVVVSAMSLVNQDLPSGCLAGGIPAKVLKQKVYPRRMTRAEEKKLIESLYSRVSVFVAGKYNVDLSLGAILTCTYNNQETVFNFPKRKITGPVNRLTMIVKDQLRRNGIRFKYYDQNGEYVRWE